MARNDTFDMQFKLLTIGDSGVGKTSLLVRYANDSFSPTFITTIGIDFKIKNIDIDGTKVRLQVWDTAGQERFKTITTTYFRGSSGILMVYDVSQRHTFDSILSWMRQIKQFGDQNVDKLLIGNKADREKERMVSKDEGQALADKYDMLFVETSAKTGMGVTEAFDMIARQVLARLRKSGGYAKADDTVKLKKRAAGGDKKKGCC